jgi:hypothetical protein
MTLGALQEEKAVLRERTTCSVSTCEVLGSVPNRRDRQIDRQTGRDREREEKRLKLINLLHCHMSSTML